MPWRNIFRVLGVIYQSFVGDLAWSEDEFVEFARRTHCLSQPGLNKILESVSGSDEVDVGNDLFPVRLLHVWAKSTSLHNSDSLRKQRFSDEVVLRDLISNISPTSQDLLQTWSELLGDEEKTCDLILPRVLEGLKSSVPEKMEQRLDIALYLISTRGLPWGTTVQLYEEYWRKKMVAPNVLTRRFRSTDWVDSLLEHPLKELILERLRDLSHQTSRNIILMHNKVTDEEKAELELMGLDDLARWTRTEEMLYSALTTFDRMLSSAEDQEGSGSTQDMIGCIVTISQADLMRPDLSLDPTYFDADWRRATLQHLSNPILQLIASATLGFEWNEELLPNLLKARDLLSGRTWETVSEICFKDSPFSKGDQTPLWQLRFQLWIHFSPIVPHNFLYNVIIDLDSLKRIEEELQSSKLGIDHAGDFFIAFFHVHYPYGWKPFSSSYLTFIPDILSGNAILAYPSGITTDIIDYLSAICHEISLDPARLIRLLVELIRADINHNPQERRPGDLLNVLKHVETHLSGKELQQLFPSCQQLSRSIRISYKQFEDSWDGVLDGDYNYEDPRPFYIMVDREDLKVVYERVVTLLESVEVFEGEKKEALWPRYLLRPTGTHDKPFKEDVEEMSSHKAKGGDNGDEEKKDNEDEVEKQQVKAVGELYQDRVDQDQNGTHLTDQPVGESDVP
ncbi:hypothetical protein FRC17_004490 [Serendipita sp. 399]|nr:hypothetical protein FRC17_004490 [Serendipita sp. 399]